MRRILSFSPERHDLSILFLHAANVVRKTIGSLPLALKLLGAILLEKLSLSNTAASGQV